MKQNMGTFDRIFRLVIAAVICVLYYYGVVTGLTGIVLFVIACMFAITGVFGSCPLYTFLGISTCKKAT